ncbi:MAG: hypothetical protein ACTTH7_01430 [Treponema sp.]
MTFTEYYLVFPEGDVQIISHPLQVGNLYDITGNIIPTPLPTNKLIAYQLSGKRTKETAGTIQVFYLLEQVTADELTAYL